MSEEREWNLRYRVYGSSEDLDSEEERLMGAAEEALRSSYSPYSRFAVGAALLLENEVIVKGANQENAAYPSGICAERVAVWKAATEYPGEKGRVLALTLGENRSGALVSPCGSCRQVLREFEERSERSLRILFPGGDGTIVAVESVESLLPFPFGMASLRG